MIFRNFRLYKFISYSLEDLFSRRFHELFERSPDITRQISEIFNRLISAKKPRSLRPEVPEYLMTEIASVERRSFWVKHKVFIPLFERATKKMAAVLIVSSIHLDNHVPPSVDRREEDLKMILLGA